MGRGIYLGSEAIDNKLYKVSLIPSNGITDSTGIIKGMSLQNEMSVSGSNDFGTVGDSASQLGGNFFSSMVSGFKTLGELSTLSGRVQFGSARSLTQLTWRGSDVPSFSLNLTFVCLEAINPKQDVSKKVNAIMRYLYPEESGKGKDKGIKFLTAPAGYRIGTDEGRVNVQIGDWFDAKKQVITNASFDYSRELNSEGRPIYATGTITFRPDQAITYDQFKAYFRSV